jgi:hypothetical protein
MVGGGHLGMYKRREPQWRYTQGADWSGHSIETRRNVEQLLAEMSHGDLNGYVRDYDSPIGKFARRRPGKLYRRS